MIVNNKIGITQPRYKEAQLLIIAKILDYDTIFESP